MLTVFVTYFYFLGLRTLTVIDNCLKLIASGEKGTFTENGGERGIEIDLHKINYNDKAVLDALGQGKTEGVFQLESAGMRNFMKELKPENLEDIIAGIALYRPGPMDFIPKYLDGKNNSGEITYDCPQLEPILKPTYGCIVYQEQVMQIVRDLAGYTLGRSDLLRRAMSKKKADVMAKERQNFVYGNEEEGIKGCVGNGIDEKIANKIYDEMLDFAKYAFNKSHAAAYAVVSYHTAYLKYYYPVEFMASLMTSVIDNNTKVSEYIMICRKMGIKILPPDINEGISGFSVKGNDIIYGLSALKSVGTTVIESIVSERNENGKFKNLSDFIERMSGKEVNKRTVESFIKAGALDSFPGNRRQKMMIYTQVMDSVSQDKKHSMDGQFSLFDLMGEQEKENFDIKLPNVSEYTKEELLNFEKEVLGVYVSGHPLEEYLSKWKKHISAKTSDFEVAEGEESVLYDRQEVVIGGLIRDVSIKSTKNNKMMAFLTIEDLYGTVEVVVFPKDYEKYSQKLVADNKVFIQGRVSEKDDEKSSLTCSKITLFDEVPSQLWIRFANKEEYDKLQEEMFEMLKYSDGNDVVVVYFVEEKQKLLLPPSRNVKITPEIITNLQEKFGQKNIAVV